MQGRRSAGIVCCMMNANGRRKRHRHMTAAEGISIKELKSLIKGEIGRDIIYMDEVDSTNSIATGLCERGALHGTVVIADSQTRGHGRLGRAWLSPPGVNIYMSVILKPSMEAKDAVLLTLMAAVACARALSEETGLKVEIKWPNDLMVHDKKLGGILTEARYMHGKMTSAIIGLGLNVNGGLETLPAYIRERATSVKSETGVEQSRVMLIAAILNSMDYWYNILVKAGRDLMLEEWRRLTSTLGRPVTVVVGEETLKGLAEDIDDEGMLILRLPSGSFKKIRAGDITHLRTAT